MPAIAQLCGGGLAGPQDGARFLHVRPGSGIGPAGQSRSGGKGARAVELRFTKEQQELQRTVRHFAETEISAAVLTMERDDEFPSGLVARMAQLGLMGIPLAKQWD